MHYLWVNHSKNPSCYDCITNGRPVECPFKPGEERFRMKHLL